MEPSTWTLAEACRALQLGEVSSVELVESVLKAVDRSNPDTNAFLRVDADLAYDQARAVDADLARGFSRGPLHGIPLAHKDMFNREGVRTSCGSLMSLPLPDNTATVLKRLDAAGAIHFGALNMSPFAVGPTGRNSDLGDCRNPWDTTRIPGGSSSGAAAAVAARASFAALGSDTAGSIRVPAALCGLTGLKPTQGRVSRAGVMGLSSTLDTVGPLARTAQDCALVMNAIAGVDASDPTSLNVDVTDYMKALAAPVRGIRVGIAKNYFNESVDPQIAASLEVATKVLKELGCEFVNVDISDMRAADMAAGLITACEAAAQHHATLRADPREYGDHFRLRVERGYAVPAYVYLNALRAREPALHEFSRLVFDHVSVLLVPTVPILTPTLESVSKDTAGDAERMQTELLRFTRPFNYLGLPGLALPMGTSSDGMPLSMQLVGRPFSEDVLLRLGHAFQSITDWHTKKPP